MNRTAAIALVMPREPADTTQVSVRIPNAWLADLDLVAEQLSRPGIELVRADILRAAIARGLQELKAETMGKPANKSKTKR